MDHQSLQYAVGIDLGGTKIAIGLIDETGHVHDSQKWETAVKEGPLAIEQQILDGVRHFQQLGFPIVGVGIGVAGQIHPQTGEVIFAPNLKWHHVPLRADIEKALQLPVAILNDVRASTWGEWLYGAGKGCQDFICLFLGTGIGSGIVSGGHLLTGCSNAFGEVGHMTIDFRGPICACGNQGCLEAFAGGGGIVARMKEALQATGHQGKLNLSENDLTAKKVIEAYRQGDEVANQIIEQAKQALVAGCANLINAFNPCRLILGGGLLGGLPEMITAVDQGVRNRALKATVLALEVRKASLDAQAGIIGSAAFMFHTLGLVS
jgi:glucokinase